MSDSVCSQRSHALPQANNSAVRKSKSSSSRPYPFSRLPERSSTCVLQSQACLENDAAAALEESSVEISGMITTLYPNSVFPTPPSRITGALDTIMYSLKERRWLNYPSPSLNADPGSQYRALAQFLNEVTRCCSLGHLGMKCPIPRTPRQWVVTESTRTSLDGPANQVTGIALVEVGLDDMQWADVLCDVQIVSGSELLPHALRRLSSGAANVFASQQDRLFHVGLVLAGDVIQLACYDRAGLVTSTPYSINDNPVIFVRIVMGLTLLDKGYGGKDPTIVSRDGRRFVTVGSLEYEIMETLSFSKDIDGRTTCWRCRLPNSDQDFVVKTVWADKERCKPEGELLNMARNVDGVVSLVCEEVVLRLDGSPYATTDLRELLKKSLERCALLGLIPQLELRRLVLAPYAEPLKHFSSKEELLSVLRDSIQAHWVLYDSKDVLHCDISGNNVMMHAQQGPLLRRGLLIDLDCAIVVEEEHGVGPIGRRAGTLPYMACDIVQFSDRVAHGPWHDLESFLYVLMIICATYSGPSNTPREDFDLSDSPMSAWMTGDGDRKAVIMYQYEDDQFRTFLDSVFDPYFDDMKDLVCELRTVILRNWDRKVTHHDVLEVLDQHLQPLRSERERASAVEQGAHGIATIAECSSAEEQNQKMNALESSDCATSDPPSTTTAQSHSSDDSDSACVEPQRTSEGKPAAMEASTNFAVTKRKADTEVSLHSSKRKKIDEANRACPLLLE
ncbi:hypothetical protein BD626DRAFT_440972 [Schizophyllum amplum]|uniref:Protein kinase domain-containing protein n=1 Tax=Schizophyllum amplum TaxID=97359 RepID=A0A550BVD1_9AGAR|nr:hypothetical protein BD626DRAFT_440972 [Auriculariopsis ampla]